MREPGDPRGPAAARTVASLGLLIAGVVVWIAWPEEVVHRRATPTARTSANPAPQILPLPDPRPHLPPSDEARPVLKHRVEAVRTSCGLPVRLQCPDECVVVVEGPDLDGPAGWARLLTTSPRFVASTALRDLGLPTRSLPCGQAIDALLPSGEVRAVELPSGAEVWCGSPQPWSAQAAAACNAAASERSPQATRFDDPDIRILRFDR